VTARALLDRLLPYPLRVKLRALLEGGWLDPHDVGTVSAVTAAQWRTIGERTPGYIDVYWDGADDPAADAPAKRRSAWLAGLDVFTGAGSVLELGCNVGRNLWMLRRRHPGLTLAGVDINPEAIEHARRRVEGDLFVGDLYDPGATLGHRTADVVFTMGVLIHLHPDTVPELLAEMVKRARRAVVLVEQVSEDNRVLKGPASWQPERRVTGAYIQWSPDLPGMLRALGLPFTLTEVPADCQSNGARHLLVVPR
jgi:SAM-dependent methyltransferase